jgi:hypothetical protein
MPGIGPSVTERTVSFELTLLLGNLAGSFMNVGVGESKLSATGLGGKVITL